MARFTDIESPERRPTRAVLFLLVPLLLTLAADAQQWTVVNLHPAGLAASQAEGVGDGQQGGSGGLWTGTAESFVGLGPGALVHGVGSGQQAGRFVSGNLRACVWSGSAASRVDLQPAGAILSEAYGTHDGTQAGFVGVAPSGVAHATIWRGSVESLVDLHPASSTFSQAFGVHDGQQVGQARFSTGVTIRAALWNGSAASFVDLHPAVGMFSTARGTDGTEQVGEVEIGTNHAALWRGSAASFVDLHPPGAEFSFARGVAGGEQVGTVFRNGGVGRATIWSGSAATAVDLHVFLPPDFTTSAANGIWHDSAITYVAGSGFNNTTGRNEALLWIRCTRPFVGDLDSDHDVDLSDLTLLLSSFGCAPPTACDGDIDADGNVDLSDLTLMLSNFGEACP